MVAEPLRPGRRYDPLEHGARCDICPLAGVHRPVPPKGPVDSPVAIVGEGPGDAEIERGSPFVGQSGLLLRDLLAENVKLHNDLLELQTASETRETQLLMEKHSFPSGSFRYETTPDGRTYLLEGDLKVPEGSAGAVPIPPRLAKPKVLPPAPAEDTPAPGRIGSRAT